MPLPHRQKPSAPPPPLKKQSIVRLELQAAVLGARLADATVKELSTKPDAIYFWSDSKVVLQYLANESRSFF